MYAAKRTVSLKPAFLVSFLCIVLLPRSGFAEIVHMPYDFQKMTYGQVLPDDGKALVKSPDRLFLSYRNNFKRPLDITLALVSAVIVLPLTLVLAAIVMLDGHNPFYTQKRIGRRGKHFRILKLRTMQPNADEILEEHLRQNSELRSEWERTQKLKDDVRVTRFGRFLRKASLDELPQLWNVLTGSMSLVGPRPMMVDQEALYPGRSYYKLRPGITGFWQISDRHLCSFEDRAIYDDNYSRQLSFATDFKVLLYTVRVVLRGTGC